LRTDYLIVYNYAMTERGERPAPKVFFEGFTFRPYKPTNSIVVFKFDGKIIDPFANLPVPEIRVRQRKEPWTTDGVMQSFARTLRTISKRTGEPLSMDGVEVHFVTPDDIRPKTDAEREYLRNKYGEYILDGVAGDCTTNEDGTFTIRLGVQGTSKTKREVMELFAHEYGHTRGDHIDSAVYEELKAYTFANLFMKTYSRLDFYSNFRFSADTVHEDALYRLEELMIYMEPEVVFAHLIDRPFAGYNPSAYRDYIRE
jgi:hypothetical protein